MPCAGGRGEGGRGRGSRQGAAQPEPVSNLKLEDFKRPDGSVDKQMVQVLDPDLGLDSEKVHDKFGGTMGISGTRPGDSSFLAFVLPPLPRERCSARCVSGRPLLWRSSMWS